MLIKFVALFLLAFLICDAAIFKTSLIKHQSYGENLIREKKWNEYRILRSVNKGMFRSRAQRFGIARQPFYDHTDTLYYAKITIGIPKTQEFRVILDTASSNLWVVDQSCENKVVCPSYCSIDQFCAALCDPSCCKNDVFKKDNANGPCDGKQKFDQHESRTYKKEGRRFDIQYGTGSVSGFLGNDTVSLGDEGSDQLDIKNTIFGQVDQLSSIFADQPFDGILGLAFRSIAADDVQPVFQHAVELGLVDKPIFTVWLKKDGGKAAGESGGQITYGGLDDEHCDKDVIYVSLSSETWWEFNIEGTGVNGKKDAKTYSAISDTGASFIIGPSEPLNKLINATNAKYNSQYGLFEVNCDVKFTWSIWISGKEFPIDANNMVLEIEQNKCVIAYDVFDASQDQPAFILGDPFIRQYCQIYDVGEGRIGLARSTQ